jgi:Na+-driven multidrug efflux pump
MQGVIKGLGIQEQAQTPALICFLFISTPCAYVCGFMLEGGLAGMWYGYGIGMIILIIFYLIMIIRN